MFNLPGLRKRFFGYYPVVNILMSNLVFLTFRYRRWQLRTHYRFKKNEVPPVQLINSEQTRDSFLDFLQKGFDKLNIGGGRKNFEGFINLDFVKHPEVEREVVANILDLAFVPDNSCSHLHSNHLVEHITQDQLDVHLKECARILKQGGRLSLRCPNALGVSYGFFFEVQQEKDHEEFLKLGFPKEEEFCNPLDGWYHQDLYGFYHWINAFTGNRENEHLNIITPTKIKRTVEQAGFRVLKMTDPETSNIVLIAEVIK